MKLMSIGLPVSTIKGAYVTGPYTLASLIMGTDEAAMATVTHPDTMHSVCRFTTEKIQKYMRLLISAGAQAICVLEPTAVLLGPQHFSEYSAAYVKHIVESFKYTGVATIYHTCGNTMHLLPKMAESGVSAVSLDSEASGVNLPEAARQLPEETAVMGNINPTGKILTGSSEEVYAETLKLLEMMAHCRNFILSTGCDLPQEVPLENIGAFMRAGRDYKLKHN
jgi:uroporphyrinogen decarboxylase